MQYKAAGFQSKLRKTAGAVICAAAALSTTFSVLRLIYFSIDDTTRIASVSYFKHAVYIIYENTQFLGWLWDHCPTPNLLNAMDLKNLFFALIYYTIFIGWALYSSGRDIEKELSQIHKFKDRYQDLDASVDVPVRSVFTKFNHLVLLPVFATIAGGIMLKLLGLL